MGDLDVSVDTKRLYDSMKALKAMPASVKTEVRRQGRRVIGDQMAREIRKASYAVGRKHASRVGDTAKGRMKGYTIHVEAGGLPYTLGAEFGGRGRITRNIATRSRTGTPYVIRARRTTMQFLPYIAKAGGGRGGEGYFFFKTAYGPKGQAVIIKGWQEIVDAVVDDFGKAL